MSAEHNLSNKKCVPCRVDVLPLKGRELLDLHGELGNEWKLVDEHHLEKVYLFKNFADALVFTNKIGALAEEERHHPDILLAYGKVTLQLWTHKINGLSDSDFVLAAKCDLV